MSDPNLSKAGNIVDAALKPRLALDFRTWVYLVILAVANGVGVVFHI